MSHSPCGECDIYAGQLARTITLDIDTQWYVLPPPLTGNIINIISTAGHQDEPGNVGYGTAKGGLLNFTRSVAMELAQYGIRVNSLTPTATDASEGRVSRVNYICRSCCLIQKCYRNFSTWGPSRPALIPALQRVPPWAHQPWRRPAFWP